MDTQNSGSFMAPAGGGGAAIQEAMARRGMGAGVANQSAQTGVLPAASPSMPQSAPLPTAMQASQPPVQDPNTPATHGNNPEAQLILKAMSQYLGGISKVNQATNGAL